ncbi:MAG: 3-oxoadipate enol-lactonase [Desulfovermiculus sp.]
MPFTDVNGMQFYYQLRGPEHAPVVMLSNSLGSNLSMWDEQVPELVAAGFQVLLYDSRGHGQSAVPQGPYSIEMLTQDAIGLLDALGLDRVFFCGLSKGGMVGQMLGVSHPERILALVLCSTSAHIGMPETWNERIKAVQEHGMQAVADATIDRWFTPAGQKRLPKRIESVRRMVLNTPVQGFCASCEAIRDMDLRESISAITLPTLVMVGEHDQGTPVSHAEFIHKQIPSSELQIIPGAAHMIGIEQADAFNRRLVDFLKAQTK